MDLYKRILPLLLVLILAIFSVKPLLTGGFFSMHDDTQPTRVYEMAKALAEGQFPVRWVSDLGYGFGYPLFNFYAPLPYYVSAVLMNFGLNVITATKIMFGIGILLAGITMYFWGRELWGRLGGVISATFYIYAPYHAVEIYVRGAVTEYWAYALFPLVFYGLFLALKKPKPGILISTAGFAGVILSHNISGLITMAILILWWVIEALMRVIRKQTINFAIIYIISLGLGLSAFFWLPALIEAKYTRSETLIQGSNNFHDHFVYPDQLWDSVWGFGGSALGRADGMSFKVGKLHLLLSLLVLILMTAGYQTKIHYRNIVWVYIILAILTLFMTLSASKFLWDTLPYFAYIQYPWRWLVFTSAFLSVVAGGVCCIKNQRISSFISIILTIIVIWFNVKYFHPQSINRGLSEDYIDQQRIKWDISRISDEYLPRNFPIPKTSNQIAQNKIRGSGDIILISQDIKSHHWNFTISAETIAEVILSIADFPGWRMFVNAVEVKPQVEQGLLKLSLLPGIYMIKVFFDNTWPRNVGNWLSITSLILWLSCWLKVRTGVTNKHLEA